MMVKIMVLVLENNSDIGANVRSNLFFICLRHLISSAEVTNHISFSKKNLFSFMRAQHVLSYHPI